MRWPGASALTECGAVSAHYGAIAFTEDVRDAQRDHGSREIYARVEERSGALPGPDPLTATEREFLAERDGFYLATVSETGWPYVQYRGGPPGFLRVLDEHTLGWADFRGNLQYVSTGNLAGDDRVSLIVMDYAHRRRLKIFGRARVVGNAEDPALVTRLADARYEAEVERGVVVAVEAFDWNCPQHITRRFTVAEIAALGPLPERDPGGDDDCCA
jgi:uncharacterized protein